MEYLRKTFKSNTANKLDDTDAYTYQSNPDGETTNPIFQDPNMRLRQQVKDYFKNGGTGNAIENLNTSNVTDMSNLFKDQTHFDADLSKWDVSKVKNFNSMFKGATFFTNKGKDLRWNIRPDADVTNMFDGSLFNKKTQLLPPLKPSETLLDLSQFNSALTDEQKAVAKGRRKTRRRSMKRRRTQKSRGGKRIRKRKTYGRGRH